ncbi:hypothetical protein M0802_001398 [Mischocyttarus mexicanus]|nr:hypothetical protein M0802_001398 [Mischocyttarus mexicanus]
MVGKEDLALALASGPAVSFRFVSSRFVSFHLVSSRLVWSHFSELAIFVKDLPACLPTDQPTDRQTDRPFT